MNSGIVPPLQFSSSDFKVDIQHLHPESHDSGEPSKLANVIHCIILLVDSLRRVINLYVMFLMTAGQLGTLLAVNHRRLK